MYVEVVRAGTDEVLVLVCSVLRVDDGDEVMLDNLELGLADERSEEEVEGATEEDGDCLELELNIADEELGKDDDIDELVEAELEAGELEAVELEDSKLNRVGLDDGRLDESEIGREELDCNMLGDSDEPTISEDETAEVRLVTATIELEAMPSTLEADEVGLVNKLPSQGPRTPRLL